MSSNFAPFMVKMISLLICRKIQAISNLWLFLCGVIIRSDISCIYRVYESIDWTLFHGFNGVWVFCLTSIVIKSDLVVGFVIQIRETIQVDLLMVSQPFRKCLVLWRKRYFIVQLLLQHTHDLIHSRLRNYFCHKHIWANWSNNSTILKSTRQLCWYSLSLSLYVHVNDAIHFVMLCTCSHFGIETCAVCLGCDISFLKSA